MSCIVIPREPRRPRNLGYTRTRPPVRVGGEPRFLSRGTPFGMTDAALGYDGYTICQRQNRKFKLPKLVWYELCKQRKTTRTAIPRTKISV